MKVYIAAIVLGIVLFSPGAVWAAKPAPPPPPSPSGNACVGKGGTFPGMSYARKTYKGSRVDKNQIYVANSLGTCEVMVYETSYSSDIQASFHFDFGSGVGVLAWGQYRDDGDNSSSPRPVIKTATFGVANGAVVGLPITASTVYTAPTATNFGFNDVEISPDGSRLAISSDQGALSQTGSVTISVLVCPLASCQSNVEAVLTTTSTSGSTQIGGTHKVAFGRGADDVERLYFIYRPNAAWSDGDIVAMDNLGGGNWSEPTVIVDRDVSYGPSIGDGDTILYDVSAHSVAGMADVLVIQSGDRAISGAPLRIDTFDTASGVLSPAIGQGNHPTWTQSPTLDNQAPNILVSEASCCASTFFDEIDLDGSGYVRLPSISGYFVDSAE